MRRRSLPGALPTLLDRWRAARPHYPPWGPIQPAPVACNDLMSWTVPSHLHAHHNQCEVQPQQPQGFPFVPANRTLALITDDGRQSGPKESILPDWPKDQDGGQATEHLAVHRRQPTLSSPVSTLTILQMIGKPTAPGKDMFLMQGHGHLSRSTWEQRSMRADASDSKPADHLQPKTGVTVLVVGCCTPNR
jgi:hypothetical protein